MDINPIDESGEGGASGTCSDLIMDVKGITHFRLMEGTSIRHLD